MGLTVRLPGHGQQAGGGVAGRCLDARGTDYERLAPRFLVSVAHAWLGRPLAEPARRLLRQRPGRSLWSRLKTEVFELRERPVFTGLVNAQLSVADYFVYYNHERMHSSVGYQTPYHAHQQLLQTTGLNCPA